MSVQPAQTLSTGHNMDISDLSRLSRMRPISDAVHEVDAKRMEDYRDDLDTLAACAGLFSAILIALLVQSSTVLAPDFGDDTLLPLRALNALNYALPAGVLSSVSPLLNIPASDALLRATHATTLWSASLICSLGTALTAILIKRRLRENKDPLSVGRVVFAIAAALPWFMQISHGLFILGLGLFTAALDEHSERATPMLVVYWGLAVLIVASNIGAFIYSRYSQKLTSSKPNLERCRRVPLLLQTHLSRVSDGIARIVSRPILPMYDEDPKSAPCSPLLRQQHANYGQQPVQQPVQPDHGCDGKATGWMPCFSAGQQPYKNNVVKHDQPHAYPSPVHAPSPQAAHQQPTLASASTNDERRVLFYVTALYDYHATLNEDLGLRAGDVIAVTATPADGWWSGVLLDAARAQPGRHIFPSNYVRMLPPHFAPRLKELE